MREEIDEATISWRIGKVRLQLPERKTICQQKGGINVTIAITAECAVLVSLGHVWIDDVPELDPFIIRYMSNVGRKLGESKYTLKIKTSCVGSLSGAAATQLPLGSI